MPNGYELVPVEGNPITPGLVEAGNIDLDKRPVVLNKDGTISTVRSMSVNFDGQEVLIPTVSEDGRILGDEEAIAQYEKTGKHLGKFDTPDHATAYAEQIHTDQEKQYGVKLEPVDGNPFSEQIELTPVEGNPFSETIELHPVDGNPFAAPARFSGSDSVPADAPSETSSIREVVEFLRDKPYKPHGRESTNIEDRRPGKGWASRLWHEMTVDNLQGE